MKKDLVSLWLLVLAGLVVTFAPLIISGCSPRLYPVEARDSIRVEIHQRIDTVTVEVEIEKQVEKVITRDTASRLENTYAISEASVDSLGFLHHSLETIPQSVKKPVPIVLRDTLYYEGHTETVTVKVNELTKWQGIWIRTGKVLTGLLAIFLILIVVSAILKFRYGKVLRN